MTIHNKDSKIIKKKEGKQSFVCLFIFFKAEIAFDKIQFQLMSGRELNKDISVE